MKHILIAPDSFKGSCSAKEASEIIAGQFKSFFPKAKQTLIPISDGGEGLLSFYQSFYDVQEINVTVQNDTQESINASFGMFETTAIIESAQAVQLPKSKKDISIMYKSSHGVGEMIAEAVKFGAKKVILGVGGTATVDLGMGALYALGAVFTDKKGNELLPIPINFPYIDNINLKNLQYLSDIEFVLLGDIENTIYGNEGGLVKYSKQKGASDEEIRSIHESAQNLIPLKHDSIHYGSGGGLVGGLAYYLKVTPISGMQFNLNQIGFAERIKTVDLLVSGEGSIDSQSFDGKVIGTLSEMCQTHSVPMIAFVGSVGDITQSQRDTVSTFVINENRSSFDNYEVETKENLKRVARTVFKVLSINHK